MSYGGNADFFGFGRGDREEIVEDDRCCNRGNDSITAFLTTLSPGILVELQYDHRRPARGVFQGFERGNVILTDYNCFPGLVRIAADRINAVAPFVGRG